MFQKTSLTFNPKPSSLQNHRNANKSLTKLLIEKPPNSTIEIVNNTAATAYTTVVKNLF